MFLRTCTVPMLIEIQTLTLNIIIKWKCLRDVWIFEKNVLVKKKPTTSSWMKYMTRLSINTNEKNAPLWF
jgi:hypothetical protein